MATTNPITNNELNSFLGTGWAFPPTFDPALATCVVVSDDTDIRQSLDILLSTALGDRIMQPQYGCDLQPYVFKPLNPHMVGYLKNRVRNAILFYETRIKIESLDVTAADSGEAIEGRFRITLTYSVAQSNTRFNYVYNYFQNEALEPL